MGIHEHLPCIQGNKVKLVMLMDNENVKNLNRFKAIFGDEGLKIMVEEFPGMVIRFPSSLDYNKEERNEKIKADFYANKSIQELAKEFMLSESHIRNIINKR